MTQASPEETSMLDKCVAAIAAALPALSACIAQIAKKIEDKQEYDIKDGSHLAWLSSYIVALSSELRQLEKHDRSMSKTPKQRHDLVLKYLRTLSPEQRAEAIAVLQVEDGRSVLA